MRAVVAAFSSVAIALTGTLLPLSASAATDENPDFILIPSDLQFILEQIQISEAHAAGGNLLCSSNSDTSGKCVRDPMLPHGLRTVDGSFNNLEFGSKVGAADQVFPRRLDVQWRQAEPDPGLFGPPASGDPTSYEQTSGTVWDSSPRTISNLIVDTTTNNPAAVDAAGDRAGSVTDPVSGEIFLPNEAADEGLSAPANAWFTFFGQFFDHGLDLVDKGGNGVIVVPLTEDDPLWTPPVEGEPNTNFMMLTRATNGPGPDGVLGTADDVREHNNETTPFVDQNQTYTSHPAHQVFLREYAIVNGRPVDTGRLLNGVEGGLATWNDVKQQAREKLGIALGAPPGQTTGDFPDVVDVPQVAVDLYGNFVPGPGGFPQIITGSGAVSGTPNSPVSTVNALRTGHAFLEDIAHGATPQNEDLSGYDNVLLGEHFITGDGRGNENIGLTAVHHVFHSEHNRLLGDIQATLNLPENAALKAAYEDASEADDWNYPQRLFQAARFGTEMQYQHLVFEEFARMVQPNIDAVVLNENSYDSSINPAIVAEFAHVVYRFGHSMLTTDIERDLAGHPVEVADMPLLNGFLNPVAFHCASVPAPGNVCPPGDVLTSEQAAGAVVNGTTDQVANQIDELVTSTLRNNLLGLPLDLASINIMRGRDAGVPPLQAARKAFFAESGSTNLEPYTSWTDFGLSLKNGNNFGRGDSTAALVNFVAAYGKHPSVLEATTLAGKRAAADLLVNGASTIDPLSRIWGPNQFATAAAISRDAFPAGASTVYIATGLDFPDALAAAPVAALGSAPVLLVDPNVIPVSTAQELFRLAPDNIIVLGGPLAVSKSVEEVLREYTSTPGSPASVTRLWGATQYDTAAAISASRFDPNVEVVYVAAGENFPDALAGGAVAARDGAPVVLVAANSIPASSAAELTRLSPERIVLLGGPLAVSDAVSAQLQGYTDNNSVTRIWGQSQYDTAIAVSQYAYPSGANIVYVATGGNFPDALAAAPVAGTRNGPVLLLPDDGSVPPAVAAEIQRLSPERAIILGGELAITAGQYDAVAALFVPAQAPDDRSAFMNSSGAWVNTGTYDTVTGLEDVDFWVGGLAEALDPFGGMLGATFNYVFEEQLENLQFGDRFYYLFRNQGLQLFSALEGNSFAGLIQRNTDASLVPAEIFRVQEPSIDLENLPSPLPTGLVQVGGQWRWDGEEHIEIHGNRTGADRIRGGQGDDALWGYGGNDRIEGGTGNDSILGGDGDDILTDTFGDDNIKGGWGNDYIDAGYGFDLVLGGHGDDFVVMGHDGPKDAFLGTGNDIAVGGTGRDNIRGGEGEDWIEGGAHADLLMGDNADQFQQDTWGAADVLIGGGGSDDHDAEGGDDVMVGQLGGTDRFHGMNGWDFVTYYGENGGVDADLTFNLLQPPDVTAIRDRFLRVEALSGGGGNDILRGVRATTDDALNENNDENLLTEAGLARILGLQEMLRPQAATTDYALRFMDNPLLIDSDGTSNLILGGEGSDVLEGRYGDDFLDGDAYLRVQLEANGVRYDRASQLQPLVLNGTVNPGDISIVREIAYAAPAEGVRDTAVYAQDFDHYVIAHLHDGYWQVTHNPETIDEIEESEGTDIIRNFEVLQFANGCWIIPPGATSPEQFEQCGVAGTITLNGQINPPTEDIPLQATVEFNAAEVTNPTDIRFNWQLGETGEEWEPSPTGDNLPDVPNGLVDTFVPGDGDSGAILRVVVSFRDDDGNLRTIASEALPAVVGINDPPTQPTLNPATPRVGNGLIASGFTDPDGLEEAAEAGITYTWQRAGSAAGPWSDIPGATGTTPGYLVDAVDVGMVIRVRVNYTDDSGFANEVYSVVSNPVEPAIPGLQSVLVEGSLSMRE